MILEAKIRAKRGELMGKGKGNVLSCMGKWKRRELEGLSREERREERGTLGWLDFGRELRKKARKTREGKRERVLGENLERGVV